MKEKAMSNDNILDNKTKTWRGGINIKITFDKKLNFESGLEIFGLFANFFKSMVDNQAISTT